MRDAHDRSGYPATRARSRRPTCRQIWTCSIGALGAAGAFAQTPIVSEATAPDASNAAAPSEIVVTGTRIVRDGYQAPTPLTVLTEQDIRNQAPSSNIADYVNQIPSVAGSVRPANSNASISAGTAGVNALNLRALGTTRTLVLLDGQRSVGSTITGAVDVNDFPQGLIKSVEIVTGGASAAYGSDAVSGVVNFILDKSYTGIKGTIEGGETTYNDDRMRRVNLTAGLGFGSEQRGHILLNGEYAYREGIFGVPRAWNDNGNYIITNPAYKAGNGQPERFVTANAGLSNSTKGGIITAGPLRGTTFGVGGAVGQFAYGTTLDPWMIGGDWRSVQVNNTQSLDPDEKRQGGFGRLSWKFSDAIEIYGEASYNKHHSLGWTGIQLNQANVTIRSDNAFIPASVKAQLGTAQSFTLGTTNADLPIRKTDNSRNVQRYVVGGDGAFALFGKSIKWDAYFQRGVTRTHEVARDITNNARLANAQDAILSGGNIVCRINADAITTNDDPACAPLNRLGIGVASPAALAYVLGNPYRDETFKQDVGAFNVSLDAFDNWAGTVSIAAGAEHRRESVSGYVPTEFQSGWFVGNYLPSFGHYSVTEGYLETVFPLAKGLDFNGAVRATSYSTSGYVTTWKAGATFQPIPDIRLRVTRSRDIRAPNLSELFQAGSTRTNSLLDPFNGNASVQFQETSSGNRNLKPERADTWGVGAVLQPRFLPGLGASIDFYDIKIKGAIGQVTAQTIIDRCFQGATEYCGSIVRGTPIRVFVSPFNFAQQHAQGLDMELSYRLPLSDISSGLDGALTLRGVATHYIKNYINNGIDVPTDTAGQNAGDGPPSWIYRAALTYDAKPVTLSVIGRGLSAGTYDNSFVECTTNCPASTVANRTINSNHIPGAFYVDFNIEYAVKFGRSQGAVFFHVADLFDKDPAIVASGPAGSAYAYASTNTLYYDYLGRVFRVGVRFDIK